MANLDWYIRANLKIRHLELIVMLDEYRSISQAAVTLGMPASKLEKALQAIEAQMNGALFEKTDRGLQPTELGMCLIRHGRSVIDSLLNAREELRDLQEGPVARVTLGILPATSAALIPRFITKLRDESVQIAVAVREGSRVKLLQSLRSGQIDLAVSLLSPTSDHLGICQEVLYDDRLVLAVRRYHPLTSASDIGWDALKGYPVVMPPEGTWLRDRIDRYFAEHAIQIPQLRAESTSTLTNIGVLQATDSIGFLALDVARHFESLGLIAIIPLTMKGLSLPVGLLWMQDRHMAHELKLVHSVLRDCVESSPAKSAAANELRTVPPWTAKITPKGFW